MQEGINVTETEYSTKTREFGRVRFIAPGAESDRAAYVWIETGAGERRQICDGGRFRGPAVSSYAGDGLRDAARRWLRQRRDRIRRGGMA